MCRIEKSTQLQVYISDAAKPRWEVPQSMLPRPTIDSKLPSPTETPLLAVTYTTKPFGFAVTRISTGDVLFNSTPPASGDLEPLFNPLVFKDQYIELSTQLPKSTTLFGLGESTRPDGLKLKKGKNYTLWTTDIAALFADIDLYGAWPFYIEVRDAGVSHGVLLLNSNGMEVSYGEEFLTYRVIGGVLDFYFFPGPSPLDVVDQYTQLVGRPAAQPYWAFGFHQCRWGYKNVTIVKTVVENFKKAGIPLDTMWNDIDYSDRYLDFTHDEERFPLKEWRAFVDELHANDQHYVILVDPGIGSAYNDYKTYSRGLEQDIFLKTENGEPYLGQVWPGPVVYPDFLNPNATLWWTNEVQLFHDQIPFDGMWIDMNEVSNFCTGTYCTWNGTILGGVTECYLQCTDTHTKYDDPPFKINHFGTLESLGHLTASMTAKHFDGTLEYDAHSLYGLAESIATKKALTTVRKKRPFLLSRSTFVASGAHTAHWTGDNKATYNDIAYSIVSVMNSGMAGIPMVGADICGFYDMASDDLCSRWIQTGAFHPFSRAHSSRDNAPKEFYLFKKVTASAKKALGLKYQLLPYYYTLNWEAHTKGYPMVRPLFMAFPTDPKTLDVSYQFLVGNHILVSPVFTENATSVEAYIPKGTWYNMFDFSQIVSKGEKFTLQAPWDVINVHVHEGAIIPMQESALTSAAVRKTPFTLLIPLPNSDSVSSSASGYLFLDDGEEIDMTLSAGQSTLVTFEALVDRRKNGTITSHVEHGEYAMKEGWIVDRVVILGLDSALSFFHVNQKANARVKVLQNDQKLELSGLRIPLGEDFQIDWTYE
uniref:Maltase n=1 Tax=Physcomitrium patens TaxID=3218 RepID=A0A7I3ZZJ0_PHYPA